MVGRTKGGFVIMIQVQIEVLRRRTFQYFFESTTRKSYVDTVALSIVEVVNGCVKK